MRVARRQANPCVPGFQYLPWRELKTEPLRGSLVEHHLVRELWASERTPVYGIFQYPPKVLREREQE